MGFFKNLFGNAGGKPEKRFHVFHVKCNRCGEIIEGRIDLDNDLSVEFDGEDRSYFVRKGLLGANRCFQQIEVEMKFSPKRELIEKSVDGGTFVE